MRIATKQNKQTNKTYEENRSDLGGVFIYFYLFRFLLVALLIFQDLVELVVISVCCYFMGKVEEGLEWRFWNQMFRWLIDV